MTKIQQNLINSIQLRGNTTIRRYTDGRGSRIYSAAVALRQQGLVKFRGVGVPVNADFTALSVYSA
jgi:hypothetical protein